MPFRFILRNIVTGNYWLIIGFGVIFLACSEKSPNQPDTTEPVNLSYALVDVFPHDPLAFTQGLLIHNGYFYESTGLYGRSSLRKVVIKSGEVLQEHALSGAVFGEGLALSNDRLVQLTWRSGIGFVYDIDDFSLTTTFRYQTEGWGMTFDGMHLIMSDGSDTLRFLDPDDFQVNHKIAVHFQGDPIDNLNELEFIDGTVWSNIWHSDSIAIINPENGEVKSWLDLSGLLPEADRTPTTNVLNGIAWDKVNKRIYVTGKHWPKVFEIRVF